MKTIPAILSLFLLSCSAQKQGVATTATLTGNCPKNANCKIELIQNKAIELKKDTFGRDYYELTPSAATNVIKYEYSKIVKGNIQDAGYREEVIFELEQNPDAVILSDKTLQNAKMLFGRFCFCKGQTGYYKVEKGNFTLNGTKKSKTAILNFTLDSIPQITTELIFTLQ